MLEQNLPLRHKQQFIVSHNFPGSAQLCLVRESTACEPKLLFWNGSTAKVGSSFKRNGRVFRPLLIPAYIQGNLRLPSPPRPYGSVEKLVTGIATAFQQYAHVTDGQGRLLADCCLASWFPEAWPVAPCLSITAAVAPDRVLILHFLSCFCRHSMVLGQASPLSLLHVAPGLQPTLLINYSEVPRKVQALINVGCYRGMPIPGAAGEMIDVFGMKVLAAAEPAIWLENALHLAIPPRQGGPATCWKKTLLEKLASEFQPQLLMYRLEHLKEIAVSDWDIPEFVSPVREVARSIGRCLRSANLREDLIELLGQQDEETRTAWSIDERAIVIEALLLACHDPQKTSVYMGEAAQIANGILKLRGRSPA